MNNELKDHTNTCMEASNNYRKTYFDNMCQIKDNVFFLNEYITQKLNTIKIIKVVLVLLEFIVLCCAVYSDKAREIYLVIFMILKLLPMLIQDFRFATKHKEIIKMKSSLNHLFIEMNTLWIDVDKQNKSIEETHKLITDYAKKVSKLEDDFFENYTIRKNNKFVKRSDIAKVA